MSHFALFLRKVISSIDNVQMSFFGSLGKKAVEKAYDIASKVDGGRDYLTSAANTVNSLVKGKNPR